MKFQYKWVFLPMIIIFSSYVQLLISQIDTLAKLVTCLKERAHLSLKLIYTMGKGSHEI